MKVDGDMQLSPLVLAFAREMQRKLNENDWKRGWEHLSKRQLLRRLKQEVGELERALNQAYTPEQAQDAYTDGLGAKVDRSLAHVDAEAADVANFCAFIAAVFGAEGSAYDR